MENFSPDALDLAWKKAQNKSIHTKHSKAFPPKSGNSARTAECDTDAIRMGGRKRPRRYISIQSSGASGWR